MKMKYLFTAILLCSVLVAARSVRFADNLTGTWAYVIADVPAEYQNGVFLFEEKDNATVGYVGADKSVQMKELTAADGKVNFKFDFDGGSIGVSLAQTGDTLKGNMSSTYGEFPIVAVKQK
jgi:hypothetical protein